MLWNKTIPWTNTYKIKLTLDYSITGLGGQEYPETSNAHLFDVIAENYKRMEKYHKQSIAPRDIKADNPADSNHT
jgi:hypothetical protein